MGVLKALKIGGIFIRRFLAAVKSCIFIQTQCNAGGQVVNAVDAEQLDNIGAVHLIFGLFHPAHRLCHSGSSIFDMGKGHALFITQSNPQVQHIVHKAAKLGLALCIKHLLNLRRAAFQRGKGYQVCNRTGFFTVIDQNHANSSISID